MQERRAKVRFTAPELGISAGNSFQYHTFSLDDVRGHFPMCGTNVDSEQKACRQEFSGENLDMLRGNQENFFPRIISGDET